MTQTVAFPIDFNFIATVDIGSQFKTGPTPATMLEAFIETGSNEKFILASVTEANPAVGVPPFVDSCSVSAETDSSGDFGILVRMQLNATAPQNLIVTVTLLQKKAVRYQAPRVFSR